MFEEFEAAIREHAIAEYPRESCGVILADGYHRLQNVSIDPEHTFECTDQIAPMLAAGEIRALVHSHPDGPHAPSSWDMTQALAMNIPWGLISCDATAALPTFYWFEDWEPPALEGRGFRYGPSGTDGRGDCAALVRDWYRLNRGVRLKEFPREDRFWLKPGVSYRDNLLSTGFTPADRTQPEVGDVFLATIRSTKPNHSGIYVGNGKIMHHLENRFSRVDAATPWMRMVTDWFRYSA
jgi:proteasome lid subunit RPN8/RPN11